MIDNVKTTIHDSSCNLCCSNDLFDILLELSFRQWTQAVNNWKQILLPTPLSTYIFTSSTYTKKTYLSIYHFLNDFFSNIFIINFIFYTMIEIFLFFSMIYISVKNTWICKYQYILVVWWELEPWSCPEVLFEEPLPCPTSACLSNKV